MVLLVGGSLGCGAGLGLAFLGAVAAVNALAPAAERGTVTSLFFALTYLLTGLPAIGVGLVATRAGLYPAFAGFAAVVGVLALATAAWAAAQRQAPAQPQAAAPTTRPA